MSKIIMLGPPGSGKGTYSQRMSPKLEIPTISTGELLRGARDDPEIGETIRHYQDTGDLVPDDIVLAALKKRLEQEDAKKGFILDGFPRTIAQAEALDNITKIDAAINLVVPDEIVIARLSARRECKKCGKIYNTLYLKPKQEGICDDCGGKLIQRDDDKPEAIRERLRVYHEITQPVIDHYKEKGILKEIDGEGPIKEVFEKVVAVLGLE